MLNVESKFGAFVIWSIIFLIVFVAAWSAFKFPPPGAVWQTAIASDFAKTVDRFQNLIGLLLGFGGLGAAYLANGSRIRHATTDAIKQKNAQLTEIFAQELTELAVDCNTKARDAWNLADMIESGEVKNDGELLLPESLFKAIASPHDTAIMRTEPQELIALGSTLYSHIRRLRQEMRYIEDMVDHAPTEEDVAPEDQSSFFKELARSYVALAHACIHAKSVCEGKVPHMIHGRSHSHDHSHSESSGDVHLIEEVRRAAIAG